MKEATSSLMDDLKILDYGEDSSLSEINCTHTDIDQRKRFKLLVS